MRETTKKPDKQAFFTTQMNTITEPRYAPELQDHNTQ